MKTKIRKKFGYFFLKGEICYNIFSLYDYIFGKISTTYIFL